MGKGRLVFPSLDVSSQEKAQKLGLLSSGRRGHCPRGELSQVNKPKAAKKMSQEGD